MKSRAILKAVTRAQLFIQSARAYLQAERTYTDAHHVAPGPRSLPVESGNLRRSSLDLTLALAEVRRS